MLSKGVSPKVGVKEISMVNVQVLIIGVNLFVTSWHLCPTPNQACDKCDHIVMTANTSHTISGHFMAGSQICRKVLAG